MSKKPTRLSRLQNYANQLVSFRASKKEDLPSRLIGVNTSNSDVLSSVTSPARIKALPASPFLVPAVIEAILSSRYKDVTSVIPGEADAYCAQSARTSGGIIFTSDSDLLVHDLGETGKVVLFKDLEAIHLPSKGKCLKTQQYQPSSIAEKFGLPNLVRLAFFMTEDNHRSFTEATVLAKERNPTSDEFAVFREQYASLPVLSSLAKEYLTHSERPAFKLLSRLDPRISELIHQISMGDNVEDLKEDRALDMYLPFLIDDSTRSSAWRAGEEIRKLAYSALRLLDPNISSINEYERKGTRVADTVQVLCPPTQLVSLTKEIMETLTRDETLSQIGSWRAFAAKIVCQSNLSYEKAPPSASDLARLITGGREGYLSWSFIHASAQLQSVLYSLRMLLQTVQIVLAFLEEKGSRPDSVVVLQELVDCLKDLPALSELLDDAVKANSKDAEIAKKQVTDLMKSLNIQVAGLPDESSATKRKKKRKKKGDHASETSPPAWRQNNPFSSLA